MDHSFEEIRAAALDILSGRERVSGEPSQYQGLQTAVAEVLRRRDGTESQSGGGVPPALSRADANLFLEVFWGLFREGIITLGLNDSNREFPFFRVTESGRNIASSGHAHFFHNPASFEKVIREAVPSVDEVTLLYLLEAMQAFRSGCLLSATVMLGVAAEHVFELTLEAALAQEPWKTRFQNVPTQRSILPKMNKFKNILDQHVSELRPELKEDLDTRFTGILSLVRTFRNESGHPTGKRVSREQVYVLLQLFVPYFKKMNELREFFLA